MTTPLLSVLMPTIWSRRTMFGELYGKLEDQAFGQPVEILALLDNKRRTIGAKCNDLLAIARGKFLTFVDDDDDVSDDYIANILGMIEKDPSADVLNYLVRCILTQADGTTIENYVKSSINHPNEEFHPGPDMVLRKPLQHGTVWRSELAKSAKWLETNYEADAHWASQLWPKIKAERNFLWTLYFYRWSAKVTEAK